MNAIGTHVRDPINSGLARWRMAVSKLDAAAELGRNPVSKHQIQPEHGDGQDARRDAEPVSRQPAHLHTQAESGAYVRDSSRVPRRRPFMNRHTPSGQSRVFRVTQLRTDGVHYRESADTGPVNLKVVPNECCLRRSPWTS